MTPDTLRAGHDVAIVGMACRFPDAPTPAALWKNTLERRTSFRPVPPERWTHSVFQSEGRDPHATPCGQAAFIDDVALFAARHFGFSPRRSESTDAQQRLMLELAREALIDAGHDARAFDRRRSAAFVGVGVSEYSRMMVMGMRGRQMRAGDFGDADPSADRLTRRVMSVRSYMIPGSLLSMCAALIAQTYDLGGPCTVVDAACAASLVAVVQAVQHLRGLPARHAGSPAPLALAGGVYLMLLPDNMTGFTRVGALARTACRPFDRAAEGFLLGEGAGLVALKRLDDAVADGDRVYAVIRGVAWNSDGHTDAPMTPLLSGQIALLRDGFEDAGVDPASVGYIETHGTATTVGDRAEVQALASVYDGVVSRPRLGSIKANIGHTLSAAGVAGLMRAALACYHATLPPQASWEAWPDDVDPHTRFPISTTAEAWKGSTRRATVSAFGFGGLNAFTVLESAPPRATARLPASPLLFCCGAETPALLDAHLCDLATAIERLAPDLLGAAAFTLSVTRSASRWRATFIATTVHDVLERITDARQALSTPPDAPRRAGGNGLVGPVSNPLPPCSRGGASACDHSDLYDVDAPPLLRQGLAWLQGHAVDLTGLYPEAARHIVDLPIAALERERFWPVAPRPQAVADADREASPERPSPPLASSSPSAPAEPAPRRERPADAVARIAARSGTGVQPSHRLVADLGFDSIMFVELATHLARVHGVQPSQEFWATDPTVAEITALVKIDPTCAFPEQVAMSTTTHPFLRDHALQGRPFVPLASALDLFAWSQGLTPPFALHDVRVTRGVMVRGETRLRVTRDANALALLETRGTRNEVTAFEACVGDRPEALEPLSPAGADSEPAPGTAPPMRDLDAFYRDHTFHGQRMRAIACVTRLQSASIEGRVRTSTPRDGAPADPRERWHVDLHMIDGAFQLALYLAAHSLDKGLLPQDMEAFVVLSAPAPGLVDVRIDVERHEGDALWARFTLSQNGTPICFMRGVRAKVVPLLTRSRTWQVAEAQRRIEAFPEVRELEARRASWGTLYPYFEPYDGVAGSAVSVGGQPRIAFTHYDYLGLNGHPDINAAAQDAIACHGTTVGASRLVAGELTLHRTLEQALADFLGVDDCVAMVSGHATNQSVISTLVGPGDLVLHDALSHDSIVRGAVASRATRRVFAHNDLEALEQIVTGLRPDHRRVLIITEGVFSMDGDTPDLERLIDLKERYGCLLMVDEAHSLGVLGATGRGLAEHAHIDPRRVDVWMGTFSKSLVGCGGYVAGSHALIHLLKHAASGFVYSVGLAPAMAAASLAALRLLRREPERLTTLRARADQLASGLRALGCDLGLRQDGIPVVPVVLGDDFGCLRATRALSEAGIRVMPIVHPAVAREASRLRFFVTAGHSAEQIDTTLGAAAQILTAAASEPRSSGHVEPSGKRHAKEQH